MPGFAIPAFSIERGIILEIDHERFEAYLESFPEDMPEYLVNLEVHAKENGIPIIRKDSERLIRFMLTMKKPKHILEVGTATGFSSLLMAEYCPEKCDILTIEKDEERAKEAVVNFDKYDINHTISLQIGDADEILRKLSADASKKRYYDFIFMDAAKGQYINFYPYIMKILARRGILISDNILQEGSLLDSRYMIPRRDRTIHTRMREYAETLMKDKCLETVVLTTGDGMTLSIRK